MQPDLAEISDGEARRAWTKTILGRVRAARPAREALEQICKVVRAPRKVLLAEAGRAGVSMYLLGEGRVRVDRARAAGGAVPLEHAGPGDLLGELHDGPDFAESWLVADPVVALAIPRAELRELSQREPTVQQLLARLSLGRLRQVSRRLEQLMLHEVESRLAAFLLDALERWGGPLEAGAGGQRLEATFRHHELAEMVGARREWVTVTLIELRNRGILGAEGRRIVVRDREALRQLAQAT